MVPHKLEEFLLEGQRKELQILLAIWVDDLMNVTITAKGLLHESSKFLVGGLLHPHVILPFLSEVLDFGVRGIHTDTYTSSCARKSFC